MTRRVRIPHSYTAGVACTARGGYCRTLAPEVREEACRYCHRCFFDSEEAGCLGAPKDAPERQEAAA